MDNARPVGTTLPIAQFPHAADRSFRRDSRATHVRSQTKFHHEISSKKNSRNQGVRHGPARDTRPVGAWAVTLPIQNSRGLMCGRGHAKKKKKKKLSRVFEQPSILAEPSSIAVGFIGISHSAHPAIHLRLPCPPAQRRKQRTRPCFAATMAAAAARSFLRSSAHASVRAAAARTASRVGPAPLPRRLPTSAPRILLRYARCQF